jgi:hypothetical protein
MHASLESYSCLNFFSYDCHVLESYGRVIQTNSFIIFTCPNPVLFVPGLWASGLA